MKKIFISLFLFASLCAFAQRDRFDIARFIAPAGWLRTDTNGILIFHNSKTNNGLTSFGQIFLFPSRTSSGKADSDFKTDWDNRVVVPLKTNVTPKTGGSKTPEGWEIITGTASISQPGISYSCMLVTASGYGKTMSMLVNTAGAEYTAAIEKFFNDLDLDTGAVVSVALTDYIFTPPEKWLVQNHADHISFTNQKSGCTIKILTPQPSSGSLDQDANAVFDLMYKGWSYQNSGSKKFLLAKGVLPGGQEYLIKEAAMSGTNAQGQYNLEEGAAMVVKAGSQIAIISTRHNSSQLGHDDCYKNYNTCRRFVNSFTIKNAVPVKNNEQAGLQRIIGLWKADATGVVAGDYAFAANGNYQSSGGLGSSTTTSDMYYTHIYSRAYPFKGDGSYAITGNLLTLKKRGVVNAEKVIIRFEKVNHGGTGWKDRLYMLKKDNYGESESLYEKQERK